MVRYGHRAVPARRAHLRAGDQGLLTLALTLALLRGLYPEPELRP